MTIAPQEPASDTTSQAPMARRRGARSWHAPMGTTVRVRLMVALAVLFAAGLAGFGIVTTTLYSHSLSDRLDAQLHASLQTVSGELFSSSGLSNSPFDNANDHGGTGAGGISGGPNNPSLLIPPGTYGELLSSTNQVLATTQVSEDAGRPSIPSTLPRAGEIVTVAPKSGSASWRLTTVGGPADTTVVVAVSTADMTASLDKLITLEILVGLLLLAIVCGASFLVITRALRPLESMAATASAIAAGDLSQRVEVETSATELEELRTALNAMLDEIEASFAEREAVEVRLRQFLADASHELRTPLTSIAGFAEILRLGDDGAVDPMLAASRIESEAARMARLVDDLLVLARMDEQRNEPLTAVDLTMIAADACSDAIAAARDRHITLDAEGPVIISGVEDHLRQAAANLLANALRYTPPATDIEVSVTDVDGFGLLSVRDHGPGIPDEMVDKIFDRFVQVDPSRAGSGAGLGLSIVAAVAAESRGTVRAANVEPSGLDVTIRLPLA